VSLLTVFVEEGRGSIEVLLHGGAIATVELDLVVVKGHSDKGQTIGGA